MGNKLPSGYANSVKEFINSVKEFIEFDGGEVMKSLLQQNGYSFDKGLRIWSHPERESIAYSDGDEVELRLFDIINRADDLSIMSQELKAQITDWPSFYHLTR